MPLNADRPINRAVVVGCAISATRNYLKLDMSRTLKILLCNTHAETRKLWKRSAQLPPLEAIPVDQFTSRLLLHLTRPPRCPLHSPRFPGMQRYTSSRALVALTVESGADMQPSQRSLLCQVPHFPRLRALALFGRRLVERAERLGIAGVQKPAHEPTFYGKNVRHHAASSSIRAFACFRSNVSKPSLNQP